MTNSNSFNISETEFFEKYNIEEYDRPSVTTDIVAFKISNKSGDSYRHNKKMGISLLLVKRGEHPYINSWALPGGFLRTDETIEECAYRECVEETKIEPSSLVPIGVFSKINRDPRGRIISNAYLSIVKDVTISPQGGYDAIDAQWFDVSFDNVDVDEFKLTLSNECENINCKLKAVFSKFKKIDYEVIDSGGLAFDHSAIIATAITILRTNFNDFDLVFDFLDDKFTLTEIQNVHEAVLNKTLTPANFRRKILDFVVETDEYSIGAGHRPAKFFKKNIK